MRTRIAVAVVVALFALAGCSQEDIDAAIVLSDARSGKAAEVAAVDVEGPTVTATVDCHDFRFTVSGYPEGTAVTIGMGAQSPWGFTVGGNYWNFTPIPGGASGHLLIDEYSASHSFDAIIDVDGPLGLDRPFSQFVECVG